MTEYSRPEMGFSAAIRGATETAITIEFALENRSGKTVYVFDRLTRFEGSATRVEPDKAFALLDGADAVRVICALMPVPSLMSISRRPPVYVTTLAPGATHRAKLELALPLAEWHPFYPTIGKDEGERTTVRRVRLQVGWVEERPGMKLLDRKSELGPEKQLTGGWGMPRQWISEADLPVASLPVIRHPEPFERSAPMR